jgi:hypothetical protein
MEYSSLADEWILNMLGIYDRIFTQTKIILSAAYVRGGIT